VELASRSEFSAERFYGAVACVGAEIIREDDSRDHEVLRRSTTKFEAGIAGFVNEDEHEAAIIAGSTMTGVAPA
jgi:hypothetical protein